MSASGLIASGVELKHGSPVLAEHFENGGAWKQTLQKQIAGKAAGQGAKIVESIIQAAPDNGSWFLAKGVGASTTVRNALKRVAEGKLKHGGQDWGIALATSTSDHRTSYQLVWRDGEKALPSGPRRGEAEGTPDKVTSRLVPVIYGVRPSAKADGTEERAQGHETTGRSIAIEDVYQWIRSEDQGQSIEDWECQVAIRGRLRRFDTQDLGRTDFSSVVHQDHALIALARRMSVWPCCYRLLVGSDDGVTNGVELGGYVSGAPVIATEGKNGRAGFDPRHPSFQAHGNNLRLVEIDWRRIDRDRGTTRRGRTKNQSELHGANFCFSGFCLNNRYLKDNAWLKAICDAGYDILQCFHAMGWRFGTVFVHAPQPRVRNAVEGDDRFKELLERGGKVECFGSDAVKSHGKS